MVRWYDWIAAFIVADILLNCLTMALLGPTFWVQFFGAMAVAFVWDMWNDFYCIFRKRNEQHR